VNANPLTDSAEGEPLKRFTFILCLNLGAAEKYDMIWSKE
jgi:hypothetical protein